MTSTYHRIMDSDNIMKGQISLEHICDCLITHITGTWLLTSMRTIMSLQITCVNKSFIT